MKKYLLYILIGLLISSCKEQPIASNKSESESDSKPVISILGMTHLHNPGLDVNNMNIGNIYSEKRQKELNDLITKLTQFKPTKIAIEIPWNDSLFSSTYFQLYLENNLNEETMGDDKNFLYSEVVQIAYPLAKEMKHKQLYSIDAFTSFPIEKAFEYAQLNGMEDIIGEMQHFNSDAQKELSEVSRKSISEIMKFINSDYFAKNLNQNVYLKYLIKIGRDSVYSGTDVVAEWYSRNLRIFTNLDRIVEPNDRILIIFGAGHKAILENLIMDRVDWEYYDINQILKN